MRALRSASLIAGILCLGLFGCKKDDASGGTPPLKDKVDDSEAAGTATAEKPAQGTSGTAPGASGGKVLETMDSGGYTYARLAVEGGGEVWVAGPETKLEVGQMVAVSGGQLMRNFESKTLGRTFPEIYFVSSLAGPGGAAPASPHGGGMPASPHGKTPAAPVDVGTIEPAPGGVTIADLYAKKGELKGKQVTVRGKVVKYNAGIMGKNWLHLQDGSGKAGASDLTVTTDATAKLGDVVTVKGTLSLDRDFGSGYKYAVIVEDATVAAK